MFYHGALDEHLQRNTSYGSVKLTTIREAWIGFPIAYVFAMCMDWFVVSGPAKGFAFRFLVKPESPVLHKVIAVSCSMVVPMVIIMSLYGALEGCVKSGNFGPLLIIWLTNIPKNFVMALPFQLIIAGPLVRKVFRGAFSGRDCVSVKNSEKKAAVQIAA